MKCATGQSNSVVLPLRCTRNEQHPLRFLVVEEVVEGPSTPHTSLDSAHVSLTQRILA